MKITEKMYGEVAVALNSYYGTMFTGEMVKKHVTDSSDLLEIEEDTYMDTCVREGLLETVCKGEIGLPWPSNGCSKETKDTFYKKAAEAGLIYPNQHG